MDVADVDFIGEVEGAWGAWGDEAILVAGLGEDEDLGRFRHIEQGEQFAQKIEWFGGGDEVFALIPIADELGHRVVRGGF